MTEPQIQERDALPYLAIRCQVTDGVPAVVDRSFPQLFAWLGQHGVDPAGPPFIRYREVDHAGEPLEIEVAAPVANGTPQGDDAPVRPGVLPAGRYVTLLHAGPYRSDDVPDLGDAQAALARLDRERGHRHQPPLRARLLAALLRGALQSRPADGTRLDQVGDGAGLPGR
jgi:GyrI-like small molecule binding protein